MDIPSHSSQSLRRNSSQRIALQQPKEQLDSNHKILKKCLKKIQNTTATLLQNGGPRILQKRPANKSLTLPKNFTKNTQRTQLNNPSKLHKKLFSQELQRDGMNSVKIIEGGGWWGGSLNNTTMGLGRVQVLRFRDLLFFYF